VELLTRAIEPDFEAAGWFTGRDVDPVYPVSPKHPAHAILRAFTGLKVGGTGPGEECARDGVFFGSHWFDGIDKRQIEPEISDWQGLLKTEFVCLGDSADEHGEFWLDGKGRLFYNCLVAPIITYQGASFTEGMERLLRGRKCRPMLLPWQRQLTIWGECLTADDPRVLKAEFFDVR